MVDQVMQIDPFQALLLIAVGGCAVVAADKLSGSVVSLKERFVDRKANRIIEAQLEGDESLRQEIMAMFSDSLEDHERYDKFLARDNRRISDLEDKVSDIEKDLSRAHERIDDRTKESTIMLKSMGVMMNRMLGLSDDSAIIDSVNEINEYLIERRES